MDKNTKKYPLGIQTFSDIIEDDYVYIDKTEYVYKMTRSKYVFLSRPRRFGKSLLASTLEAYFKGRKELFKGLAIDKLETEWTKYPVLHFDMSSAKHGNIEDLESELNLMLLQYEKIYGKGEGEVKPNQRLMGLIERAHIKTGEQAVVIIDEYDAPLLDVMHEEQNLKDIRKVMQDFYSPIKKSDKHLRFVFITGITKFSQLSIFSELNNLNNISMDEEYAGVCGITEEEMLSNLDDGIMALAERQELTKEGAVKALKDNYDGYHFAWPSPDVYNPYSLLFALSKRNLRAYWFTSGTPTYLIEMLRKFHVTPSRLCTPIKALASGFDAPTERMTSIVPLLYQSGYVTIKELDPMVELYTLGIPNREIRIGLMESLLPNYLGMSAVEGGAITAEMQRALLQDDINQMFKLLQDYLGTVPYVNDVNAAENKEGHWQQMLYVIFSLLGATCDVEVHTPKGRIDLVARTASKLYIIEVKLNKSVEEAMNQIDLNEYDRRFKFCGLPVVKVGVNFDQQERNITDWQVK